MKLHDQITTIEQSRQLVKLGIEHHSIFTHVVCANEEDSTVECISPETLKLLDGMGDNTELLPAFTASELMVMLPRKINYSNDTIHRFFCQKHYVYETMSFICCYGSALKNDDTTLSRSLAEMLIYLLENNLTTADECNERLKA